MRNRFVGFVAHIGESKRFAAEFAVAGIDDEMMFFAKSPCEIENVDISGVRDASQRF